MSLSRVARAGIAAGTAVCIGLGGTGCVTLPHPVAAAEPFAAPATPPGITLRTTRGTVNAAGNDVPGPVAYADDRGRLIYIYRGGSGGAHAACDAPSAAEWEPAAVPEGARGTDGWSTVTGHGGKRQWSFKGNPAFVRTADDADARYSRCSVSGTRMVSSLDTEAASARWCVVLFDPAPTLVLPDGMAVRDIPDVSAQGLVDRRGMTLYSIDCGTRGCEQRWIPLAAAAMANPVDRLGIVERTDRGRQWTFQGRPLYTFAGDAAAGDVNGLAADPRARVALITRYFTPAEVAIRMTPGFGSIWTTAAGMTLYSQNQGGKNRNPSRPVARVVCDLDCLKVWRPLIAPEGALASGYWTIVPGPGRTRQWAYRGHRLFTYALDERPGDMRGEYLYEYLVRDRSGAVTQININVSPTDRPWFWRPAFPY